MNVLVTGGSGFLGQHLVPRLIAAGHEVSVLSRRPGVPSARTLAVDLTASASLGAVPWVDFDVIYHLAAAGVKAAHRAWPDAVAVNIGGTMHLLNALAASGRTPRLIVARTFYEDEAAPEPALQANPYIATKAIATELVRSWARHYAGPVVFARIFQVYGPGDDPGSVLNFAARRMATGQAAQFGSGTGRRDWLYVDDAAAALATLAHRGEPGVSEWDIGAGTLVSVREVVELLADTAGADRRFLRFDPARDRHDTAIAGAAQCPPPGWLPTVSLVEGLKRLWAAEKAAVSSC